MLYLLSLIIAGQYVLLWLLFRDHQKQSAAERNKLLDRIQLGAEKANLIERQREAPPAPRKPVADFPAIEGVEFKG
jgi:hypothetical protein